MSTTNEADDLLRVIEVLSAEAVIDEIEATEAKNKVLQSRSWFYDESKRQALLDKARKLTEQSTTIVAERKLK